MSSNDKKKNGWTKYIAIVVFFVVCAVVGVIVGICIGREIELKDSKDLGETIAYWILAYLWAFVSIYAHIVIHEAGHLVFGLKSGYKFSSFRIMSFMWIKEDGKLKVKRLTLAGTGGQCLMIPPQPVDGKIPVMLYNFGGAIMNFIVSVVFSGGIILIVILSGGVFEVKNPIVLGALIFAVIGLIMAASNAIPFKSAMINNDGHNAISMGKDKLANRAFWLQLMVNAEVAKGNRLKDMPQEWFDIPTDEAMKNSIVAAMGVFACNKLMDEGKFEEADKLMEHMLGIESGMVDIHRNLLICDRIFCEIIGENRRDIIDEMYTKKLKSFLKTMKKFPTVIRTEYVYALRVEKDEKKAEDIFDYFERYMKVYPYKSDVESERELMEIARGKSL